MQQTTTVVFTAKEILDQIHVELVKLGAETVNTSVEKWKQYVLARAIEDVFLIDLTPVKDRSKEMTSILVRSNYRRRDGENLFTIEQDVGTNKLFPYLRSSDLPFESQLELHGNRVTLGPRQPPRQVQVGACHH